MHHPVIFQFSYFHLFFAATNLLAAPGLCIIQVSHVETVPSL